MFYLERTKAIVAEISSSVTLHRGEVVGTPSSSTSFFSAGYYYSSTLGRDIYLGVKERIDPTEKLLLEPRALIELATIASIAEYITGIRDGLLLFYALLRGAKSEPIGLLMEDFSEGGRLKVESYPFVPEGIVSLFGKDILDEDNIDNIAYRVGDKTRYGDLYPLFKLYKQEEAFQKHPMNRALRQVKRNIDKCTISLGKDL